MSYPTTDQLTSWGNTLTAIPWKQLMARIERAIEHDRRGGTAIPDGYPTTTLAGNGTTSELTSVEAAAYARTQGARDEHHDRTKRAVAQLAELMLLTAGLHAQLDRIEGNATHPTGREPGCSHHQPLGIWQQRFRGDLCQDCYRFKLEHGCLPPFKLLDDRARGIRWTTTSVAAAIGQRV